jgi:hypothetical protein
MFNVFNHPNFGQPDSSLGDYMYDQWTPSSYFGTPYQMLNRSMSNYFGSANLNSLYSLGGPRSIQLSMKLSF